MDTTILYVDDEDVNLFLFEKTFESFYTVITAKSGDEGLQRLEENQKDIAVVISDMRMPGMNGIEFIEIARGSYPRSSYFILTGYEFNTDLEKALDTGLIDKIFKKPFDSELIKAAIDKSESSSV